MSDYIGPLQRPVITGIPGHAGASKGGQQAPVQERRNFGDLLRQSIATQTAVQPLTLSKHAQVRAAQREIPLDKTDLERLDQAVDIARDKGLTDTLVLMNNTAFIVNVPNRVVITLVEGNAVDAKVFTNIDGAVIV